MKKKPGPGSFFATKLPRMFIVAKAGMLILMLFSNNLNAAIINQQRIDMSKKNASGEEIFKHIRKVSNYTFVYDSEAVGKIPPITLDVKDATVGQIMDLYLKKADFTYVIENNTVIIRSRGNVKIPQKAEQPRTIEVTGVVTDAKKLPVTAVTIKLKGAAQLAFTDSKGFYKISIPTTVKDPVLVFSAIGMKRQEVAYTGKNVINVVMHEDIQDLGDVVVTGIFNKPKESYTGAAREITEKELKQFQGRNLFTTLGNIDPSFYVVTNNSFGSDPNKIPDIQIRGTRNLPNINQLQDQTAAALNTPLIILDGFETTLQRMMDLDNNEILSVTLLKDGSATALYGSRGANGVVVIKTKEPVAGKLRLTYRAGLNLSIPDLSSYHLLNSADKLELERLSGFYESATQGADRNIELQKYYNSVKEQVVKGVNTDWLAKPLRTQLDQTHNLKVEGGDQTFRYDLALQYNNINGVMKGSGRKAYNGTINLSYRYKNLTFRNNLMIGHTESVESPYGAFSDYVKLNPYWSPYDSQGNIAKFFTPYNRNYMTGTNKGYDGPYANPLYDATLNTYSKSNYTSIVNNFQLEWTPVDKVFLRSGVGITGNMDYLDDFKPAEHSKFAGYDESEIFRKGSYTYGSGKSFNYTANISANYSNLFADVHRVYAGISADMTENNKRNYVFNVEGFPDESIDFLGSALQYQKDGSPNGNEATDRRVGLVSNVNYAYKERYLADFTYRVDGSSQFGTNRRFAPFWSAGIGWNMHYESFIKERLPFIDKMKLKASYGSTGSQQFGAYQSLSTYNYIVNDRYKTWLGAQQSILGNPDLEWQKTNKINVGLELSLFKDWLTIEADAYSEKTSNLLSSLELPYSNGFADYVENIGKLQSKGIELRATAWLIKNTARRFMWSVTGNVVYNEDKIVKLSEAMKAANEKLALSAGSSPNKIIREGASQNTIYVVRSLGIDPSTGKELFLNRNGGVTYTWDPRDRVAAGLEQPKFRGNFSTSVYYKDLSISTSFGFRLGGQLYNATLIQKVEDADRVMNVDSRVFYDRWKQPGDRTFFRGINETSTVYASSRFVQNESTLTCQNINVSYNMNNKKWLNNVGVQSLTLSGNTGELFYVSTVRQERGTGYPFTRQFSMSLYATF